MMWQRIKGYLGGLLLCLTGSLLASSIVGRFWPDARFPLFIGLSIFWLSGFLYVLTRDMAAGGDEERAVFQNPEQWDPKELPCEFRFITRSSTLENVVDSVGP